VLPSNVKIFQIITKISVASRSSEAANAVQAGFYRTFQSHNSHLIVVIIDSFDCSEALHERDTLKCYYNGTSYNLDDEITDPNVRNDCDKSCYCKLKDDVAKIHCDHIQCPEIDDVNGDNCIDQYDLNGCCIVSKACGKKTT